jgi:hypothetical protein
LVRSDDKARGHRRQEVARIFLAANPAIVMRTNIRTNFFMAAD